MSGFKDRCQKSSKIPFVMDLPNDLGVFKVEILGESKSVAMRSGLVTLQPGQDVGVHSTKNYEELILVFSGQGEVEADGLVRKRIYANCAVYIPPNTTHNVFNIGSAPLRYIYVVAPASDVADKSEK